MSSESFHRHHRRGLDAAVRRAFTSIVHPFEHAAFEHLLEVARARSDLLAAPPILIDRMPRFRQVDALRSLARWYAERRGDLDRWPGARGHPLHVVDSLARHALGGYPTPRFLASVWFGSDRVHQGWFVAHARGQRLRSLALPVTLTRRMEHVLLATPDPGVPRVVLTIEIDPRTARIVQVRGPANQRARGAGLEVLARWAARERLTFAPLA